MGESTSVQERFLDRLKDGKRLVTVFVTNGFQLKGLIADHDRYTILLLESSGKQNLIYKSAVSTVVGEDA